MSKTSYTVLGTGMVGQAHVGRLLELGHEVHWGCRDALATADKKIEDHPGYATIGDWVGDQDKLELEDFAAAAEHGQVVLCALKGEVTLQVLESITDQLMGKILIDISNPLDFSNGMPPTLSIVNDDSLGEQVQAILPDTKVVKAFNTMYAGLQVNPALLAEADHHLFLCGNDQSAKDQVTALAKSYGWQYIVDLGDISNARGTEQLLPIWIRLWGKLDTAMFNFKVVK